ncbi:MAG: YvcK family protein [Patescibacteria group bacterium]|jgi:uncharacterized cofD-like protein|nr:YvcK family protein [Patescibacteria group bacterium]
MEIKGAKIVVIGGGTGGFTLLSGLKNYASDITAIVNMADDGGSTGQLRDELGVLPPGDIRQCLVALSDSPKVRELFNYRFEEGTLKGHAFGNLFLTALEKMTGSFAEAVDIADEVLNVKGRVVPVTLSNVNLILHKNNKKDVIGQFKIGNMKLNIGKEKPRLGLYPLAKINPVAKEAIEGADLVVIAPGNLYGSLAPTLLVKGIKKALTNTRARIVYVCNLVTKPGQTDGFRVNDFASEIERFIGAPVLDFVLYNTQEPNKNLLAKYNRDQEFGVEYDKEMLLREHYKAKGYNLISRKVTKYNKSDKIASSRSLIRHDSDIIARQIMKLYFS